MQDEVAHEILRLQTGDGFLPHGPRRERVRHSMILFFKGIAAPLGVCATNKGRIVADAAFR